MDIYDDYHCLKIADVVCGEYIIFLYKLEIYRLDYLLQYLFTMEKFLKFYKRAPKRNRLRVSNIVSVYFTVNYRNILKGCGKYLNSRAMCSLTKKSIRSVYLSTSFEIWKWTIQKELKASIRTSLTKGNENHPKSTIERMTILWRTWSYRHWTSP